MLLNASIACSDKPTKWSGSKSSLYIYPGISLITIITEHPILIQLNIYNIIKGSIHGWQFAVSPYCYAWLEEYPCP